MDEVSCRPPAVILIVEDEPLLRELAVEIVEAAGFAALQARDAEQAIGLLESRLDIAVLFTDVDMPGNMDGLTLAHAVRQRWPTIEILIASGHVRLKLSDLPSNTVFLGKPYRGEAVISRLCSLIVAGRQSQIRNSSSAVDAGHRLNRLSKSCDPSDQSSRLRVGVMQTARDRQSAI